MTGKIIGIDLGTTFSCVAVWEGGGPTIVTNSEGDRTTPSVAAFTEGGECLVGHLARRQAVTNPVRTISSIKRQMGTDHRIGISALGKTTEYSPQQISAIILQKLKQDAEVHLGGDASRAVITVPAYFNDAQRQATKDAGEIAGLDVVRIINEPTAAALAYGLDKQGDQTILVYDLGGGTFDVSILEIGGGVFTVLATDGDTRLGGDDFDQRIVEWLLDEFRKDNSIDLSGDASAMQRLRDAAELAKRELSTRVEATIILPFITADATGPKHIEKKLTRARFEAMIDDYLKRTISIVDATLREAGKTAGTIHQVVLVGGSTRIPKVQELIGKVIPGRINREFNPDEVVAAGAAIQGGVLEGEADDVVFIDVTPLTLSIETVGGVATPLIERNTKIPTERTKTFTTAEDNQPTVEIHVVQGERKMASDNMSLGKFQLTGLPPASRGIPQIDVTFSIDVNCILHVSAKDKATDRESSITIKNSSGLDKSEIARMQEAAAEHQEEDRRRAEHAEIRNRSDQLIYSAEKAMADLGDKVETRKRSEIDDRIRTLRTKLDQEASTEELKRAMEDLSKSAQDVVSKAYEQAQGRHAEGGADG